jgi:tripartite-type tricarboxylate transporter receptor subunit TctC
MPSRRPLIAAALRPAVAPDGSVPMLGNGTPLAAVPGVLEPDLPPLQADSHSGAAAPAGLPRQAISRPASAPASAVADPAAARRSEDRGVTPSPRGSADFTAFVAGQVADGRPAIRAAGVKH